MMPQPHLEPVPDSKLWRLVEPWRVWLPITQCFLSVDAGVLSDGESTPWILWGWPLFLHPYNPNFMAPCFGHDVLCASALVPRKRADEECRAWMLINGRASADEAERHYRGVRIGAYFGIGKPSARRIQAMRKLARLETYK